MNFTFWLDEKEHKLSVLEIEKNDIQVSLGRKKYHVSVEFLASDEVLLSVNGKIYNVIINSNSLSYSIFVNGRLFKIERKSALRFLGLKKGKPRKKEVKTSMPGKIVKVIAQEGDKVKEGQAVLVLEAMKMQNEIKSPQSGIITHLILKPGDSVEAGSLLYSVE